MRFRNFISIEDHDEKKPMTLLPTERKEILRKKGIKI